MADFTGTTTVDAPERALFDFLSDVRNLPRYFAFLTSAEPGEGEEVHTTATLSDGTKVEGSAWFRVDEAQRRIEWGAEGESEYHGHLVVRSSDDIGSEVEVHIHSNRLEAGNDEAQVGIDHTLAQIKLLVEKQGAVS